MKKFIAGLVILFVFAVSVPLTTYAQTCRSSRSYRRTSVSNRYYSRNYSRNYSNRYYQSRGYVYQRPSFYQRHRDLINVGLGTGAGALIGGLIGGRRGVGYGALAGGGGGALYTYVLRPKHRRIYR